MATASWRTCRECDVMRSCDHPNFILIGPLIGELLRLQHFANCNMAAVRHLEFEFRNSGPSRSQLCGSITVEAERVNQF